MNVDKNLAQIIRLTAGLMEARLNENRTHMIAHLGAIHERVGELIAYFEQLKPGGES